MPVNIVDPNNEKVLSSTIGLGDYFRRNRRKRSTRA